MTKSLYFLVLGLLVFGSFTVVKGSSPVISNNNPQFIDEVTNPITLNWSVLDEDLRSHQIYQGELLINNATYNHNYTTPQITAITFSFTLGNGRYVFRLIVTDNENQIEESSFELLKGEEPVSLASLSFKTILTTIMITSIFLLKIKKKYWLFR